MIMMDCISSMLMLAPAALLILKLSGRRLKNKHMFFLLLYLCVLTGIYSVTGIPDIKDCSFDFTLNLIPLVDVLSSPDQYLLNILMFLPVGFLLPLLWDEYQDFRHLMGFCCFLTVFIEVAQVFTFRTTDVDDLLTNLLGAALDMRGFLRVRKGAAQGLDHRFWDAAAVVRYLETDPVWPFGTGGHSNRAAFGIVPDTVADQVGKSPG